jgi:hypothetical protein
VQGTTTRALRGVRRKVVVTAMAVTTVLSGFTAAGAPARAITTPTVNATISSVSQQLTAPVVGIAATPTGKGYWRVGGDGSVLTKGDAVYYGNATKKRHDWVIGIAATPTGKGYWIVDRKGGVYAFGDAPYRGSMLGKTLKKPVVGMAATPTGKGYWLVASDGGIFTFNAPYRGSTGAMRLNKPIVGMSSNAKGTGYWLVAADGGIFAFNAPFRGSTGSIRLNKPIVGMAPSPDGYTMVASDGGLFRFGTAPFYGSAVGACPGGPAVALTMSKGAVGYWIAFSDARTYAFSPSTTPPKCTSKPILMSKDLHTRTNAERAARGLPGLAWDANLAAYAANWAKVMSTRGLVHSNIGTLLGPFNYIGENIAIGGPKSPSGQMHVAWMNSAGHRSNILAKGYTAMGAGVFCGADGTYLVEVFGRASAAGSPPAPGGTPPLNPIARPDMGIAC